MSPSQKSSGQVSTRLLIATLTALLLIACGRKAPDAAGDVAASASSQDSDRATSAENPCSLLDAQDVEAALGGKLAGPAYRFDKTSSSFGPSADGGVCRYEGANFHFIEVDVEWQGGAQSMGMYGKVQALADQRMKGTLRLADGAELSGEWDEAKVVNCCTFLALRGDQLVTVDVTGSNATLEQAGAIADAALKRIDTPLKVDAGAGVAAALARAALRPKERAPCSLLSRAEVETAAATPLANDPVADDIKCTYTFTGVRPWNIVLEFRWRNGYAQYREHFFLTNSVIKALVPAGVANPDPQSAAAAAPGMPGPWEVANEGMMEFWAVKKDVLIKAQAGDTIKMAHARDLVAAVIGKL